MTEPAIPDVVDNPAAHRFELNLDGQTAFADYRLESGAMVLPHTVVPPALEGRGIAGRLASFAMQSARDQGLKIVPTCSFMAAYMTRRPETHDLVREDYRARLGIPAPT